MQEQPTIGPTVEPVGIASMHETHKELAEEIIQALASLPSSIASPVTGLRQLWVGVVGAPASGKSTLTREVARCLEEHDQHLPTVVIPMDGYHYYKHQLDAMPDSAALHARRGAPWTFNGEKFVRDLQQAKATGHGNFPSFDHHQGDPVENQIQLLPSTLVVLVEGNYLSLSLPPWNQLHVLFHLKWHIACPAAVARARVIQRHISTGNTIEQATRRADDNDVPNGALVEEETAKSGWATRVIQSK